MESHLRRIWSLVVFALFGLLHMTACSTEAPRIAFADLEFDAADAGSGEKLFNQSNNEAPACSACHTLTGESSGIGNSLSGLAATASQRIAGQTAHEYLYWSILRPGQHLVAGYSNLMYSRYEDSLESADLADLIAYLLTLD